MITLQRTNTSDYREIIEALNQGGQGYVAIVDDKHKLIGLVTDGDVRRCLLDNTLSVTHLINMTPATCLVTESYEYVIQQLNEKHLKQMLLVDSNGCLAEVVSLDANVFANHKNKVVIMAGGLGSRLGELTKVTPKPMLHIAGKPIISHIIERFRNYGFRDFIISTNYKKEVIEDFLKNGREFGVNIEYVNENTRMGTAGALSLMREKLDLPFFVTNADVISMIDYPDLLRSHINSVCHATMCVRNYDCTIPFGVIQSDNNDIITDIVEKPTHSYSINAGIYVLNPELLAEIPDNTFYDMPNLFLDIAKKGIMAQKYQLNDYWIDIGNPDDYLLANKEAVEFL
ncbi:nucleotidyltransferase family protein [Shewanella atlantica]|uniref:CBS domain-containing protein n=1 Tax=Shewanella atlantica TaxID=271099 RepID=A0A3S0IVQ3_9GAMM|nr:nucleotidyltransferase family protein [Shewanella atlantica]RTR32534.1 CBS domain-containing protein [Shewanella atlantica]